MSKIRSFIVFIAVLVFAGGCSGAAPSVPPQGKAEPTAAATVDSAIGDWSMEGGAEVAPMAMDMVMAEVDARLASAGNSRMRSRFNRKSPVIAERSEAPFFHIAGDDPNKESLPLESTSAKVDIAGVIAQVLVTQVYRNRGTTPIEAVYVFPASTRKSKSAKRRAPITKQPKSRASGPRCWSSNAPTCSP
jgi:hypothetical protein